MPDDETSNETVEPDEDERQQAEPDEVADGEDQELEAREDLGDEFDDEATRVPKAVRAAIRGLNLRMAGELVLHFPTRDVVVVLDGDAAMRILTMYARRSEGEWADHLDPNSSSAFAGWLVLDFDEPLAMSWRPGVPGPGRRTAVDPAV